MPNHARRSAGLVLAALLAIVAITALDIPLVATQHGERTVAITVGDRHACALLDSGAVVCWGDNIDGGADAPAGSFSAVSAGSDYTCGLRPSGAVECWGGNHQGQTDAPAGSFSAVSAGHWHTCGLRLSGVVVCWGG